MMSLRIILLCIAAAVLYGLLHDQITVRICLEYFTVAHPRIIRSDSPTVIALYWGFAATWWVGVLLGIPLAFASRACARPRLSAAQLARPIAILLVVMAFCALASGITGFLLVSRGNLEIGYWADLIPPSLHARFQADAFAHLASYGVGFLGGIVVVIWAILRRRKMHLRAGQPAQEPKLS
ncbi:MAG TPA: hypothetical protein VGM54_14555 [Chthoniobacter sp.]|jgi:hypothetical protein